MANGWTCVYLEDKEELAYQHGEVVELAIHGRIGHPALALIIGTFTPATQPPYMHEHRI